MPSQTVSSNEQSLTLAAAGRGGVTITESHKKAIQWRKKKRKMEKKLTKNGKLTKTALCKMSTIRLGGRFGLANESISGYAV